MNIPRRICLLTTAVALVLGIQFYFHSAGAQGPGSLVTVIDSVTEYPSHIAITTTGGMYIRDGSSWFFLTQCPTGTPVDLRKAPYHGNNYILSMENGDVYTFPPQVSLGEPVSFSYLGNVFGQPVQVERTTWGTVKGAFRDEKKP